MNDLEKLNEPKSIPAIWADTRAAGFTMASEPLTCSLLRTLAASKRAAKFLELGSGTGLSAAWLLDGMDSESSLTTVDNDDSLLSILKRNLGADPRLKVVCADGDDFLRALSGERFDFIFADTWAGKYRLLHEALELLNPAGLVCRRRHASPAQLAGRSRREGGRARFDSGANGGLSCHQAFLGQWRRSCHQALTHRGRDPAAD